MKIILLIFPALWLSNCSKVKTFSTSQLKSIIDSANLKYRPSNDLLPPEFNSPALENVYFCNYTDSTHVSVLRLRDNQVFIYETYYKPYNWARIGFKIGNYRISDDTIYVTYKPLLKGHSESIYLRPALSVSWIPPGPPDYLLLNGGRLRDPVGQRLFNYLTDKPEFDFERLK